MNLWKAVLVTPIVTELDEADEPVTPPPAWAPTSAIPLSRTPFFVKGR